MRSANEPLGKWSEPLPLAVGESWSSHIGFANQVWDATGSVIYAEITNNAKPTTDIGRCCSAAAVQSEREAFGQIKQGIPRKHIACGNVLRARTTSEN